MEYNWVSIGSLLVAALALLLGQWRTSKAESDKDASSEAAMLVKLENIQNGITEIKSDMKGIRGDVSELRERMGKVEASAAQAHHRLDDLTTRLNAKE